MPTTTLVMVSEKRKATEDSNPLLNAAKKTKKEGPKANPMKRKLGEELPGGLIIRREKDPVAGPSQKKVKVTDTLEPLASSETPQINKNKLLRGDQSSSATSPSDAGSSGSRHRRRSSLGGRGKRVSDASVIVQPHNSITPSSFYKHIDADESEQDRLRQLLIWCASRAASSKPTKQLPQLSPEAAQVLKEIQDEVIKMLADKELLGIRSPSKSRSSGKQKENEQNRLNRLREIRFTDEIRSHEAEVEEWSRLNTFYETWFKQEQSRIDSAKSKGKQKANTADDTDIRIDLLTSTLRTGLSLSRSVLGLSQSDSDHPPGWKSRQERQSQLDTLIPDLEFKLDTLYTHVSSAKATASVVEKTLDERFQLLSAVLTARSSSSPPPLPSLGTSTGVELLSTYVPRVTGAKPDTHQLFRALANVDRLRGPSKVGDAARRAQREVQRAEESGAGGMLAEKKLTIPPTPATPRKVPGTPRRGNTPRANTPGR